MDSNQASQTILEGISEKRQKTYAMRTVLKNESFVAFRKAVENDNFAFLKLICDRWLADTGE